MPAMRPVPITVCLLLSVAGFAAPAHATLVGYQGDARDPDSRRLLYREEHLLRRDGDTPVERIVLYRCPDGSAFARKRVDYRGSTLAPAFELVDAHGHREGLRREGGKTLVWSGSATPKALGASRAPLVADAGFDEFLRQRWTPLLAGQPQPLAFAVPAFGRSLPFKVRSVPASPAVAGQHRFELRVGGVLGVVAPSIAVDYDARDRRLRRFVGMTNVRDARGELIEAEIDFPHAPQPAEAARWQAAAALPLVKCRIGG